MIKKCRQQGSGASFDDIRYPTLEGINQELSKNAEIPSMSIATLSMVLRCLKFRYDKILVKIMWQLWNASEKANS